DNINKAGYCIGGTFSRLWGHVRRDDLIEHTVFAVAEQVLEQVAATAMLGERRGVAATIEQPVIREILTRLVLCKIATVARKIEPALREARVGWVGFRTIAVIEAAALILELALAAAREPL